MSKTFFRNYLSKKPQSRLSRRILLINLITLLIPLIGILQTNNYRQTLIERDLAVLETDANIFAAALASTSVINGNFDEDRLSPELAGEALRRLEIISGHRARLFVPGGLLIFDTAERNTANNIEIEILPESSSISWFQNLLASFSTWLSSLSLSQESFELYQEFPLQKAEDYTEVQQALNGIAQHTVRQREDGRLVITAAVPVQLYRRVLGALMLSSDDAGIAKSIQQFHLNVLLVFLLSLSVTILLSVILSRTIARPLYRLAQAANIVERKYAPADLVSLPVSSDSYKTQLIPNFSRRRDEIGHLSHSLNRMTQALQHRIESMEHFAADISHELRNPITSMRSALENIARSLNQETDERMVEILQQDIGRLDRLISDIAESCRLEVEFSKNLPEKIDLTDLLKTFIALHQPTSTQTFIIQFADQPVMIVGYRHRLGQVLENLVTNAKSFSPPQGHIFFNVGGSKSHIWFNIGDEGPGIAPENFEKIFERFFSLRPQQEKFGHHSGLGLSICRQIIEGLGGKIYAGNRYRPDGSIAGALFTVELPRSSS